MCRQRAIAVALAGLRGQIDFWWMQMIDKQLENETIFRRRKIAFRCDFASHRKWYVRPKRRALGFVLHVCVWHMRFQIASLLSIPFTAPGDEWWTHMHPHTHTYTHTRGWKANSSRRSVKCVCFLRNRNPNKTEMNKTNEWSKNHSSKSGNQKTLWI